MTDKKDALGDRMKAYEFWRTSSRLEMTQPICVRLDGKGFSKFTKGLKRPFDERLSNIMVEVTKFLVQETKAKLGYTQSDEISLFYYPNGEFMFDAKIQKLTSILSSMATAKFNQLISNRIPEKSDRLAFFDCRAWNVPLLNTVGEVFLWRYKDCRKNSISMAAHDLFGHKKLQNKNSGEKLHMMMETGVDWNEYPDFFKYGTFVQPYLVEEEIPEEFKNFKSNEGKTHTTRKEYFTFSLESGASIFTILEQQYIDDTKGKDDRD